MRDLREKLQVMIKKGGVIWKIMKITIYLKLTNFIKEQANHRRAHRQWFVNLQTDYLRLFRPNIRKKENKDPFGNTTYLVIGREDELKDDD